MTLIGRRCKGSNICSRALLIARDFPNRSAQPSYTTGAVSRKCRKKVANRISEGSKSCQRIFQAAIARGFHLFPFRTEKLSPAAPMVLPAKWESRSPPFSARGEGFHLDSFPSLLFYTPLFLALLNHLIAE